MLDVQQFTDGWSRMVARVWSEEGYLDKLKEDPHAALSEFGISTKEGSKVRVWEVNNPGQGSMEEQVADWLQGDITGLYDLWIPAKPPVVEGGVGTEDVNCCTPCCCCT